MTVTRQEITWTTLGNPTYQASIHRGLLGYGWTVRRDGKIIGACDHWWLRIFFQNRVDAVDAATRFAQHDHITLHP